MYGADVSVAVYVVAVKLSIAAFDFHRGGFESRGGCRFIFDLCSGARF